MGCTTFLQILLVGSGKGEARKQSLTSDNQGEKKPWLFPMSFVSRSPPSLNSEPRFPPSSFSSWCTYRRPVCCSSHPCMLDLCPYILPEILSVLPFSPLSSGVACPSALGSCRTSWVFWTIQCLCASKRLSWKAAHCAGPSCLPGQPPVGSWISCSQTSWSSEMCCLTCSLLWAFKRTQCQDRCSQDCPQPFHL